MELTPGTIALAAVAMAVTFVLIRLLRRHEAAPPVDAARTAVRSNTITRTDERASRPLVDWLLDRAFEQTGVPVADDPLARERIAQAATKAMDDLEAHGTASISLPFLTADASGPKHFAVQFRRSPAGTFEQQQ